MSIATAQPVTPLVSTPHPSRQALLTLEPLLTLEQALSIIDRTQAELELDGLAVPELEDALSSIEGALIKLESVAIAVAELRG